MALKTAAEKGSGDIVGSEDKEEGGHQGNSSHGNGVATTAQDPMSPISLKEFQERAL